MKTFFVCHRDTSSHLDGGADCPSTSAAQAADTPPPNQPVLDMQPAQDHHHHHPKRPKLANGTSMDVSITPGTDPSLTCTGFLRRGCAPNRSKSLENAATKSSSPPSRYQDLTLLIPNGAADPPPPAASMEVRVFKDMLSPAERQHAQELNGMDIPLQINIEDAPLTTSRQAQQVGRQAGQ
ncbi:hypothetical protein DUNSADRAFT_10935 [Dunaliella salina]|uniref:Encoded protein n=1 Tax=Dunaliella salina TaxID=3046 RepID=A0ABQ7GEL6_DUNSA|nr:hypothetical protein DUNSADRAFT_10935 [Dunaliella salina]|eukprot:KAF5833014.1 hypothetical protein DUNSADRAFT_10935 [Dunaliella salina]